uniref:Uncharacterized protein n=1 Tax=Macaca mulatta TaxID=9544 RepID=A0A5F8A658_MACMU
MISPSLPWARGACTLLRVRGPTGHRPPELGLACERRAQPQLPPAFSLHTSPQAEGAGSGLGQPRKGLPQCSGGLKGSSSATRVDAEAEEAQRGRATITLSPLNRIA